MKKEIFLVISLVSVSLVSSCQTNNRNLNLKGTWIEFTVDFIDRRDSIIDKEYFELNYLIKSYQETNEMGNIKNYEMSFLNDSIIIGKLYYLSNVLPSKSTIKYKFIDEKTMEMKVNNNKDIKINIVHILYSSEKYLILGYENNYQISMYKKQENIGSDFNLNVNDKYFMVPFIEKYIKLLKLNIKIK